MSEENKQDDFMSNWDGMPMVFEADEPLPASLQRAMAGCSPTILSTGADGRTSSFTLNADGTRSEPTRACQPGPEFTAYVQEHLEPFPRDAMMPAKMERSDLWAGRKLRLKLGDDHWTMASVVGWNEWNTGPFCPVTFWKVTLNILGADGISQGEAGAFREGDLVEAQGLVSATGQALNGCSGSILQYVVDAGRFAVAMETEEDVVKKQLKPENLRPFSGDIVGLDVAKCDVESGGQLDSKGTKGMKKTIDFEWVDPAV